MGKLGTFRSFQVTYLFVSALSLCRHAARQREEIKECLTSSNKCFFLLSTEGPLVITRACPDLFLSGTPSQETGTSPSSCLLLENRLYMF